MSSLEDAGDFSSVKEPCRVVYTHWMLHLFFLYFFPANISFDGNFILFVVTNIEIFSSRIALYWFFFLFCFVYFVL
jgi:hypothetical protein